MGKNEQWIVLKNNERVFLLKYINALLKTGEKTEKKWKLLYSIKNKLTKKELEN